MAEGLGLASGVIAVVDITVKAGSTYVKLMRLWNEVKEVPESLQSQTEEINDLENCLLDIEENLATSPLPPSAPSRALLERHVAKCRSALTELKDAVDLVYAKVTDTRGFRRKIAATKAVLRKDDLDTLTSRFDRALKLFQLAQAQERRWIAIATFTAMVDANNRERLSGPSSGALRKLPKKQPTAFMPPLNAGSGGLSMLGRFHLGHGSNGSFQLSYQAPTWLTQSVYSLLAQRETRGWQFNLRAYEVVEWFDKDLSSLMIEDDVTAVSKYLFEHKMTPFARSSEGSTLLFLAAAHDAYEVTKFLLKHDMENYAAEIFARTNSFTIISEILANQDQTFRTVELLEDLGLNDYIDTLTPDDFEDAFMRGISRRNYQALLDKSGLPNHWLSISKRLEGALDVVTSFWGSQWTFHDLCFLLPEIASPERLPEILELSIGANYGSLMHTLAIGMGPVSRAMANCNGTAQKQDQDEKSEQEEKRWARTIFACIKAAPTALQHLGFIFVGAMNAWIRCTPFAAIIIQVVQQDSTSDSWLEGGSTKRSLVKIRALFGLWIKTLAAAGVDLLSYGKEEKRLQELGCSTILHRICCRKGQVGGLPYTIDSRASIVGITYGSLPSQWQIWIVDNDYEYAAGEFWEMIEGQQFSVPGDWVDPVDEWDETDQWLLETPPPLIWSEYRKIRPPV